MLLQKRNLRSRLDLLRSDHVLENRVRDAQYRQMQATQGSARDLAAGDAVWARDYTGTEKWVKGTIVGKEGTRRYTLDNGEGRRLVRHIDQIKRRSILSSVTSPSQVDAEEQVVQGGMPQGHPGCSTGGDKEGETLRGEEISGQEPSEESRGDIPAVPSPRPVEKPLARSPVALRPLASRRGRFKLDID